MSDILKPCPFCGSAAAPNVWLDPDGGFNVSCSTRAKGCGAFLGWEVSKEAAIKVWNTRAGTDLWRPIEAAPRDGSWVLLAGGKCVDEVIDTKPRPVVGQWSTYLNGRTAPGHWQFAWYDGGYYGEYENPTHWMALPELETDDAPDVTGGPDPCKCGSTKIMIGDFGTAYWWMQCQSCGLKIDSNNRASEAERIAAWNAHVKALA
jgi:Lar family restriction alleviation protein